MQSLIYYASFGIIFNILQQPQLPMCKELSINELKLSEEKFRLLSETSKDIIISYGFDGKLTYINKAGIEFTGINIENYKEHNLLEFIPIESHETIKKNITERIEGFLDRRLFEIDLLNYKRERHTFEINSSPILNNGKIIGFLSSGRDITERKKAEEQILISHKTYQGILDSISEAVYILDETGTFLEVNKTAEKMYGYSKDFFIGKTPEFVSAPGKNDLKKVSEALIKAFNGEPQSFEFWGLKNDGSIFPKEVNCTSGNFFGKKVIISVARDITEQKKAKDELKRTQEQYFQLVENAVDAIFHGDPTGNFIGVNPRACEMTGYSKDELLKMNMKQLFTAEEASLKPLRYDLLTQGQIVRTERRLTRKDGTLLPIEMNTKMMPDKTYQSFFRDFSERKQMEEELIKAKEKAEENEKLKSAFLANMSHEIRTPMNGIIGFAKLLKKENITSEQRVKYIEIINTSGSHLLNLINDIIDISKIDAKQMIIHESKININKLIKELYSIYHSQLITKCKTQIQLKSTTCLTDNNAFIFTDETRLRQILTNLLSNATKFTETGSIEFGYTLKNNELLFHVKDTGIGIQEEKKHMVFERFIQGAGNIEKLYGGAGLGLAISKACAELLGGKIWLDSSTDKGTTFYFSMPYKISSNENPEEISINIKNSNFNNYTILIVEDDLTNLTYLKELFEPFNINLIETNNGKDAIDIVKHNPHIDIILMDVQLPEINGYDAMKQIKEFNPDIPVIIQTAFAFESDKQKSINAGSDGYISKPIDSEKLFTLIKKLKK
ncbi:MAG: PAS domain S-box protein [Bacteroidia bacterium]|nr:PAS domain S-box protein [Bacteroidia bacterium]